MKRQHTHHIKKQQSCNEFFKKRRRRGGGWWWKSWNSLIIPLLQLITESCRAPKREITLRYAGRRTLESLHAYLMNNWPESIPLQSKRRQTQLLKAKVGALWRLKPSTFACVSRREQGMMGLLQEGGGSSHNVTSMFCKWTIVCDSSCKHTRGRKKTNREWWKAALRGSGTDVA